MDLGRWLRDRKKQLEGVAAQVNPRDGGKTYSTVVNNKQPVQRPQQPRQNNAPAPNQAPQTTRQQVDESYGTGFSSVGNRLRDILDSNTKADRIKRQASTGLSETYTQEQDRLAKVVQQQQVKRNAANQASAGALSAAADFVGKGVPSSAQTIGRVLKSNNPVVKKVGSTIADKAFPGLGMLYNAAPKQRQQLGESLQRTGTSANETIDRKKQQAGLTQRETDNKWIYGGAQMATQLPLQILTGGAGLANLGVQTTAEQANRAEAAGRTNEEALGIGLLQGVATAASEKVGIDRFLPGSGGSNALINALSRFGTEGGQEAQQQFTQNFITNRAYDSTQGLKDGVLESAVLGGLAGAGTSVAGDAFQAPPGSLREKIRTAKQNIKPLDQNGFIEVGRTPKNIHPDDQAIMSDFVDYQRGLYKPSPTNAQNLELDASRIAERYGLPMPPTTKGLADTFAQRLEQDSFMAEPVQAQPDPQSMRARIQAAKQKVQASITPLNQGGYAQIPFGKEVSDGLSQEQTEFINNYANMLEDMGSGNGVEVNPETGTRVTNNARNAETKGKQMSKYDWFNEAKRQIDSGEAIYGASEDYKNLPKQQSEAKPKKETVYRSERPDRYGVGQALLGKGMYTGSKENAGRLKDGTVDTNDLFEYEVNPEAKILDASSPEFNSIDAEATKAVVGKNLSESEWQKTKTETLTRLVKEKGYDGVRRGTNEVVAMSDKALTPLSKNAPQYKDPKPTNLVLSERTTPEGNTIQKVRTAPGKVEERTLTAKQYAETFGETEAQAIAELAEPTNNAATQRAKSAETKQLIESISQDDIITNATREAQVNGEELNFFARKDKNGRSVGVERFDPSYHRIEAGFVTDNKGNVLGNHIKVDETGMMINVGGDVVNIDTIVGNPQDWTGHYKLNSTMERNIYDNAPNKEVADKTYKFLIAHKIKNEAVLKTELREQRQKLNARTKDVMKAKPMGKNKKEYREDIFDFIENNMSQSEIASKYGPKATAKIVSYKNETRKLYDTLLGRANTVFEKFGEPQVEKRKDYITHINELMGKPSFAGELYGQLQNTFLGEGNQSTRGGVPGNIAGRTENFEPRKKWNKFFQRRKGGEFTKDPFKAVDAYLEPTLYNIHMTESAVRGRAIEAAFRAAEEIRNTDTSKVKESLSEELAKYKSNKDNAKLITGFQEYANALAGKTQRFDRQLVDSSNAGAKAMQAWQGLQRIGGQSTILGNISSVFAQTLNQPGTIADAGVINYAKGVAMSIGGDKSIEQSPFIKARRTKVDSKFRSKYQKAKDVGGVPLQLVEMAMVEQSWNAEYSKVKSEGLKGQEAIIEADRRTERVVAGRGIADKPELYRSTIANGFLQYTLEVSAQNKKFFQDYTPAQKAKFIGATFAMNSLMGAITGFEPLPDYLDAALESLKDFMDDDDDRSTVQKGINAGQRFLGETASMNPLTTSAVNTFLDKNQRKSLFGSESSLGMFEGTAAPVNVVKKGFNAVKAATEGDWGKAAENATGVVPFGNQVKKTVKGAQLLATGKGKDSYGNEIYNAPDSVAGKAQALVFGPNATSGAKKFYSLKDEGLTTDQIEQLRDSAPGKYDEWKKQFLADNKAKEGREKIKDSGSKDPGSPTSKLANIDQATEERTNELKNSLSPDDWTIYNMSKAEQAKVVSEGIKSAEDIKGLNAYVDNKKKELGYPAKSKPFYEQDYKERYKTVQQELKTENLSTTQRIRKEKQFAKLKIQKDYDRDVNDMYWLSKTDIANYISKNKNGQKIGEQLLKLDRELFDAGLVRYLKFKNGLGSSSGGRGGSKGGGGRGKKASTSLAEYYSLQSSTNKKLRQLLAGTNFKGGAKPKTPATKKAAQKKITVNTKA